MTILNVLGILFFAGTSVFSVSVVVKSNGDEVRVNSIMIHQGNGIQSESIITFSMKGTQKKLPLVDVKRVNLKDVSSRKRGVITWNALLIMKDNRKMEIQVPLNKISGSDVLGNPIEISSASIDKISF